MKLLQKSFLLVNNESNLKLFIKGLATTFLNFVFIFNLKSQVINYISNGSFEDCINCTSQPFVAKPKFWEAIDSSSFSYGYFSTLPPLSNLPKFGTEYQSPRTGFSIILSTSFCGTNSCVYNLSRGYPRNRLKQKLKPSTVYCAKFYLNIRNGSSVGIDGFGLYFVDNTLDTIKYCSLPLNYVSPQVQNQQGHFIIDTLNWTLVTGTFVANGTEKYAVLGNFKNNAQTYTTLINPSNLPDLYTDVFYDDVSCIELNLPAFAGRDTSVAPGANVFLGRQPDVGIDEACVWYKLPGTLPIDTIAGFWVNPTTTSTYVVVQTICGLIKSDTVVVHMNLVGFEKLKMQNEESLLSD